MVEEEVLLVLLEVVLVVGRLVVVRPAVVYGMMGVARMIALKEQTQTWWMD